MSAVPPPAADLFESIHTLCSVRRFRPDPVPENALRQIVEAATRAPSARNAQPWYFVAVRNPQRRHAIAAVYERAWRQAQEWTAALDGDADIKDRPGYDPMMKAVDALASNLDQAPVLVLACLDTTQLGPMADSEGRIVAPQPAYASIFPAVQNLMLAARGLGLGSTLTTVYSIAEADVRAAIGAPAHIHIAALVPVGYPAHPFRLTKRKPVSEVLFLERWGKRAGCGQRILSSKPVPLAPRAGSCLKGERITVGKGTYMKRKPVAKAKAKKAKAKAKRAAKPKAARPQKTKAKPRGKAKLQSKASPKAVRKAAKPAPAREKSSAPRAKKAATGNKYQQPGAPWWKDYL